MDGNGRAPISIESVKETSSTGSANSSPNIAGCQDDDNPFQANAMNDFFIVMALSFHSVFEGLAVGLETEPHNIWILFAGTFNPKQVMFF